MDKRRLFAVEMITPVPHMAHFELRNDEEDRLFHISFRDAGKVFVINRMIEGSWGKEKKYSYNPANLQKLFLLIDVVGGAVIASIGSLRIVCKFDSDNFSLKTLVVNACFASFFELPARINSPYYRDVVSGEVNKVNIYGKSITIPKRNSEHAELLAQAVVSQQSLRYLNFLGSRLFNKLLVVIDLHSNGMTDALGHAILLPCSVVYYICNNQSETNFLTKLARLNRIANLKPISLEEIELVLNNLPPQAEALIQGDEIFEQIGVALDRMSASLRSKVHIYSSETFPVPGNRVFCSPSPFKNIHVNVKNTPWELNHHAGIAHHGRRRGLDVVVATYNAKDYLIDCVESLICSGRDDVRIIVVNDGSTDGCEKLVEQKFSQDPRVTVVSKLNGGCASARNYGRLVSDATHIAFVDADDFVSENFFADLYDLALYTGCEVVQGGFDFYDKSHSEEYQPSYEDKIFSDYHRILFGNKEVVHLQAKDIIKGQPTIWRRVYRTDFLDAKNIYFPENVRAYDDYIFHIISLTEARDIWMMPSQTYHYRQHPSQDIRAGDDRHFYMLHMFTMLLRRSVDEGWHDFYTYSQSIMDSIEWSSKKLRPDLVDSFLVSSARFCVSVQKVYGEKIMSPELLALVTHPDFLFHFRRERAAFEHLPGGVHWSYFSSAFKHPDMLRMRQNLLQQQ